MTQNEIQKLISQKRAITQEADPIDYEESSEAEAVKE